MCALGIAIGGFEAMREQRARARGLVQASDARDPLPSGRGGALRAGLPWQETVTARRYELRGYVNSTTSRDDWLVGGLALLLVLAFWSLGVVSIAPRYDRSRSAVER